MYSMVYTAMIHGIDSRPVEVETDVSDGMPVFEMVGYLSSEVREARDRVRTALKNCGLPAAGQADYHQSLAGEYPQVRVRF